MKPPVFKRLFSYLGPYKWAFGFAVLTALLGTLLTILAPKLLGNITTILSAGIRDQAWTVRELADGSPDPATVWAWSFWHHVPVGKLTSVVGHVLLLTAMCALSFAFCAIANRLLARVASDMVKDLRRDIDAKMHRLKLDYYDTRTNGDILSVVTNDVDAVNTMLGKNFYPVVTSAITLLGALAMLSATSPWLTLVALAMIPGTLLATGPVMKVGAKNFAAQQNLLGAVNGYVEETFGGQDVVSSFNQQRKAVERFDRLNGQLHGAARKAESFAGTCSTPKRKSRTPPKARSPRRATAPWSSATCGSATRRTSR